MNNIVNRRSIRKYNNREVSNALLKELLSKAERTPTMGNLQLYSVVVTRNSEMKHKLAPTHFNQPMVENAAVVLTFCADFRRTTIWAENRKGTPGYNNFLSFMNAATDALLYCQTFTNLAEAEGLDKKAEAMKKYGEAAVAEMYFKALPEVAKNVAAPLNNIDKITMYGDGNTSKLISDITQSIGKINDGISDGAGIDIKSLLAGFLGGKVLDNIKKDDVVRKGKEGEEENNKG